MYTARVRFGAWHPIESVATAAPPQPGVLQTRANTLIAYPRGKSAMVFYAASGETESLRAFVAGFGLTGLQRAQAAGARLIRFGETEAPSTALDRLVREFTERFGSPPVENR